MLTIIAAIAGGFLYRWRGMALKWKKYFPRPFNQIAFAAPYALACVPDLGWWALGILALTTLATLSGHGGFLDMGTWKSERDDETLEFIIKPLQNRIPDFWYDSIGMAITGLVITLPAGIALGSPILALSGALKSLAYIMGWKLFDASVATARAEFLTGFFLWGSLAWLTL